MGNADDRRRTDAQHGNAGDRQRIEQLGITALNQQKATHQQKCQHRKPHRQHPPTLDGLNQQLIDSRKPQPQHDGAWQRRALQLEAVVTDKIEVLLLQQRSESQPAKPYRQLIRV